MKPEHKELSRLCSGGAITRMHGSPDPRKVQLPILTLDAEEDTAR